MKSYFPAYCILLLLASLLIPPEAMCVSPDEPAGNLFLMDSGNRLTNNPYGTPEGGIENGRNKNLFITSVPGPKSPVITDDGKKEPGKPDLVFTGIMITNLVILIIAWIMMFCFFRKNCIGPTE